MRSRGSRILADSQSFPPKEEWIGVLASQGHSVGLGLGCDLRDHPSLGELEISHLSDLQDGTAPFPLLPLLTLPPHVTMITRLWVCSSVWA